MSVLVLSDGDYRDLFESLVTRFKSTGLDWNVSISKWVNDWHEWSGIMKEKAGSEQEFIIKKVYHWLKRLHLANQLTFENCYTLRDGKPHKITLEVIDYSEGGKQIKTRAIIESLKGLRYNLRDNNGLMYASQEDLEILNSVIEQLKDNLILSLT